MGLLTPASRHCRIIRHLSTMIGITPESALYILGEIGTDMSVWRDSASLSSWAGLSPANNESANKKKSTKIGNGGHYLKHLLVQCALAAIKSTKKEPYFYQALVKRRGHKTAIIAIACKMLVCIYHMIRNDAEFLPVDYDEVITHNTKTCKGLNLENIITFLGEHGAAAETKKVSEKEKQSLSNVSQGVNQEQNATQRKNPHKSRETSSTDSSKLLQHR